MDSNITLPYWISFSLQSRIKMMKAYDKSSPHDYIAFYTSTYCMYTIKMIYNLIIQNRMKYIRHCKSDLFIKILKIALKTEGICVCV